MCCKNFWKKIAAFALAFALGLLAANILRTKVSVNTVQESVNSADKPIETVYGYGESDNKKSGCQASSSHESETASETKINILSKPQARYTDTARKNNVQGTVVLKVTFTAAGKIGSISPVTVLPDGLTEQAILAARQICFEPPKRNGVPYSVVKTVVYSFTIY